MNEEESSETYKLGAKEYNAPEAVITRFISTEGVETKMNFGSTSKFWETLFQETLSPPPRT